MTLPVVDVLIRPDSTFAVSGTGILGTITLGGGFLLGAPAVSMVSIANATTQISIRRGRTRATDSFDSGSATVSFVDTTGQFNPDNTGSNLYPYVLPLRQFRISATVGSTSYQLFNGYTTKYTYQFDPGVNAIFVTIEAEDAFRTLSMSSLETVATAAYAESSGARIIKILTQLGIPNSIRSISAGNTQVADDPDTVRTGLEAVQQVEEAELGAFFIDKNGFYKYFSRQDLQLLAGGSTKPAIVFNETTGIPYEGVQIAFDDEHILNFITVDGELLVGTEVSDAESIQNYFNRTLNKTNSLLITDAEALNQANYLLGGRKDPKVTIDSIDFNVSGMATTSRTNLLTNPSFGTNTNNWTSAQSGGIVRTTDFAYTGVASMKVTCKNALDNNIANTTPTASTTGNHTFSMYVYIPTGSSLAGRTVSLSVEGGTATVSAVSQTNATLVAGSWVRLSTTKNVTATGTLVLVARLSGSMSALLTRTNLIPNPSFESNTTGWNPNGSTNTRVAATWSTGSFVYQIVHTGTGLGGTYSSFASFVVTAGQSYTASFYAKSISGTLRSLQIAISWYNSAGALISSSTANQTLSTSSQRWSVTGTAPATAAHALIYAYTFGSGLVGDTWQMDSVLVEQSSTAGSYFDGSRPGASWTGAANNSTSTLPPRVNLIPNPSFESNATSWATANCTIARITSAFYIGTACLSVTSSSGADTAARIAYDPNTKMSEGVQVSASAYVYNFAGTNRQHRIDIRCFNGGIPISTITGTAETVNVGAGWTRITASGTTAVGTTFIDITIFMQANNPSLSNITYVDAILLEQAPTVDTYFDGSTNDETSWVGTVNNSASIYGVSNIYVDSALFETSSTADTYFDGSTSLRGITAWTGTADASTSIMKSDAESVVNAELLDPVTVTKNYAGGTISKTLTIQGINHSITPGNWEMSLELAEPVGGDGLVLDSQNQGILNTNILVY